MMPEISVVIPAYNHAVYIEEAVQSVLNQTISNLEVIVIDDGSTDNTLELLEAIPDSRLRVIRQTNQGAHAAINRGLAMAHGEFLAILNSDDVYHPQRLEILVARLKKDPEIGLIGSFIEVIDNQGNQLGIKQGHRTLEPWLLEHPERSFRAGNNLHEILLTENYYATTSNFVFRRNWYERVGTFLPLRYTHDWDFALRMARTAKLEMIPEPLLQYRVHESNTIRENQAAMVFEICWILAVHLPQFMESTWFKKSPISTRVEQLLYSIYTFQMERILSVMLLQKLDRHPQQALQLLEPTNPTREKYLVAINEQLAKQLPHPTPPDYQYSSLLAKLKTYLERL